MHDDLGLGEAHRRLDRMETRLDTRVVSLNAYLAERNADRNDIADLRVQLEKLEARVTWAWRAAITGVMLPLVVTFAVLFFRAGGS